MGLFSSQPDMVNSRGDTLSDADSKVFQAPRDLPTIMGGGPNPAYVSDPAKRAEMLQNWLTAGGKPTPVDISKVFAEKQAMAGVQEKASAGQGINSLFGIGKSIGDMGISPDIGGPIGKLEPPKMIEPMNQSPMQTGVPYTAKPIGGR